MRILLVTRKYADALKVKQMISWEQLGVDLLIDLNPPSALRKLQRLAPDVLILFGFLDNTHLELYLHEIQEGRLDTRVLVLPGRWNEMQGQTPEMVYYGVTRVIFTSRLTGAILRQALESMQPRAAVHLEEPAIDNWSAYDLEGMQKQFSVGTGQLVWLCVGNMPLIERLQLEGMLDSEEGESHLTWKKMNQRDWLALVRDTARQEQIHLLSNWIRDSRATNAYILIGNEITPGELKQSLGQLYGFTRARYFMADRRVIYIKEEMNNCRAIYPAELYAVFSELLITVLQGDANGTSIQLRKLYQELVKPTRDLPVLLLIREMLRWVHNQLGCEKAGRVYEEQLTSVEEELEMACAIWSRIALGRRPAAVRPFLDRVFDYLGQNYANAIVVKEIADALGMSESVLSRQFKRYLGCSVITFLLHLRIFLAGLLLIESQLQIHQIAEQVGFTDPKYFSRVFRQVMQCTPVQYRSQAERQRRENADEGR